MKLQLLAAAAVASMGMVAATPASAAYLPSGVQNNVALATVLGGGWSLCYQATYAVSLGNTNAGALSGCGSSNLMLAARETGSSTILLLAQASFADVTFNVGNGNTTHNANGVEWYYSPNYSWGFAQGGDTVSRGQCDTNGANGAQRLCWHTIAGVGGWRAGVNTNLNGSTSYEKLIFSYNGGGAVPEPATWALMITGFGLVGATLRRRRVVAA